MQSMQNLEKSAPHNMQAEQAVLGAMIMDRVALITSLEKLRRESFYFEQNGSVYEALRILHAENQAIDITTLSDQLEKMGQMQSCGGLDYLAILLEAVPTSAHIEFYVEILIKNAVRREMLLVGQSILKQAMDSENEVDYLINEAEKNIMAVSQKQTMGHFIPISDVLSSTLDYIEQLKKSAGDVTGIASTFRELDKMTAGFQKGDLVIIGARPSMGKTAFVLNIAQQAVKANGEIPVIAIFSLEMAAQQLIMRMLSAESRVAGEKLRTGNVDGQDWNAITIGLSNLNKRKIFIDDSPGVSIQELRSKARRLKVEHGLDMIAIDYLQLIRGDMKGVNRQEEVAHISRLLKSLARELEIPVIALTQLSRNLESRPDKRPIMSDIRESGSIEQDADVIAFLYRDDYYNHESEEKNIMEIIIGKQRNGPIGTVKLVFQKDYNRFENISGREEF
ncbi:replicative DNA helicase DnaB [Erysipelotrichaceae bacterium]|nr:replicative DNA helicase DnaB [Erysipelotrichaceae bacterium]